MIEQKTKAGDKFVAVPHLMGGNVTLFAHPKGMVRNKNFLLTADECMALGRELIAAAKSAAAKGRKS